MKADDNFEMLHALLVVGFRRGETRNGELLAKSSADCEEDPAEERT